MMMPSWLMDAMKRLPAPILAIIGFLGFALGDIAIKYATTQGLPLIVVLFIFQIAAIACAVTFRNFLGGWPSSWPRKRILIHVSRALCIVATVTFFSLSFTQIPLSQAYSLIFAAPIWVALLAMLIFREPLSLVKILCISGGMAGVLLILRPGFIPLSVPVLMAFCASLTFACGSLIIRYAGPDEPPMPFSVFPAVIGGVLCAYDTVVYFMASDVTAIPFLFDFMARNADIVLVSQVPWQAYLVTVIGGFTPVMGITGYVLAVARAGHVSDVAPYQYTQMIWGVVFGWVLFGEMIDMMTMIGGGVIIASGLILALWVRKRVRDQEVAPQPEPVEVLPTADLEKELSHDDRD